VHDRRDQAAGQHRPLLTAQYDRRVAKLCDCDCDRNYDRDRDCDEDTGAGTTRQAGDAVVALGDYAVGIGSAEKNRTRFALTQRLATKVQRIRMHGSAAIDLTWFAAGQVDALVMLANKPWDTAAGAMITDRDGSPHSFASSATIAANPSLLPVILDLAVGDHADPEAGRFGR